MVDEGRAPMPRNAIMDELQQRGVATRPGTHAIHMLGHYRRTYGFAPADFPNARDCGRLSMSIPLHNRMTAEDYAHVVAALREIG